MLGLNKERLERRQADFPGRDSRSRARSRSFSVCNLLKECSQEKTVRVREAGKGRGRK